MEELLINANKTINILELASELADARLRDHAEGMDQNTFMDHFPGGLITNLLLYNHREGR